MCTLADRCQQSLLTLTAPPTETLLCPQSIPEAPALAAVSDSVVFRYFEHLSWIEFGQLKQRN